MHRKGKRYVHLKGGLSNKLKGWHPADYKDCLFNPFVMMALFKCRYFEHIFCGPANDPTRGEYVRFLLRMLSWKVSQLCLSVRSEHMCLCAHCHPYLRIECAFPKTVATPDNATHGV